MTAKPHHPRPATIGDYVTEVGKILRDEERHDTRKTHCRCLECTAGRLAQIGWPASVTGDGRGGNAELTAVEAAATEVHPYAGIDVELAQALRVLWASARMVHDKARAIRKHESDNEQVGGLGDCVCCGHFCNPRKDPNDRRRHGLCNACNQAWRRWITKIGDGIWLVSWWCGPIVVDALRPDFIRHRRAALKAKAA